ncbi:MAG: NfeD family protein [Bdellovibrionaceae bacterium]|jgi:membrane protein implicated in regulation of membrane protease activity|nr:NfeD family protein [Pseudobdellovibrionaceae bacterium]
MDTTILGQPVLAWQLLASLGLIFTVLEIFIPGFIMLPIGLALFLTAVMSLFVSGSIGQLGLLAVNLIIIFFVIKKVLKLKVINNHSKSNVDDMAGKRAEVTETIVENGSGYVKLYGDRWQASMSSGSAEVGDKVEIIKVDGNKVLVKKLN